MQENFQGESNVAIVTFIKGAQKVTNKSKQVKAKTRLDQWERFDWV